MEQCILVEGRADVLQVAPLVQQSVCIIQTNGTISEVALEQLVEPYAHLELFTLFDADYTGDVLRKLMDRLYSECTHLYIDEADKAVECTPRRTLYTLLQNASIRVKDERDNATMDES
ncbi:MAG: hypothetical protein KIG60_04400 [Caryophanon sp.]|nr:hypothetical protein [Caryophanon sp.]